MIVQINILFFMRQKHFNCSLIQINMWEVWRMNANIMATFSLSKINLFSGKVKMFIAAPFSNNLMQSTCYLNFLIVIFI